MCRGRSFTNGGEDGNTVPGSNSRNITVVTRVWVAECVPNITFGSQSLCPAMTALFWHYYNLVQDTSLRIPLLLPNKSLQNFNNYSHRMIIARRVVTAAVSLLLTGWSLRCSVRAGMVTLYMCTLYTTLLYCSVRCVQSSPVHRPLLPVARDRDGSKQSTEHAAAPSAARPVCKL